MMTGSIATAIVACQPMFAAMTGANSVDRTVPELPAPAIPIANPWRFGGNQRQRNRETRTRDAEQETYSQHRRIRVAGEPADRERNERDRHRRYADALGAVLIAQVT